MTDDPDTENTVARAAPVPRHVAIIMDGNGRWAEQRGQPRHAGHRAGVNSVRSTIEVCIEYGVEVLTIFAFSSENWRRPKTEINLLMELFLTALQREVRRLQSNGIRLRVIGDIAAFPEKLQKRIRASEEVTANNRRMVLQVAANYGGRWDITQAARSLAVAAARGELDPNAINETMLADTTLLAGQPDPDLFIRTGGDQRLSNFLLWHCAYTELYFTPVLWPDFDAAEMKRALTSFGGRQRRFGRTGAQVELED